MAFGAFVFLKWASPTSLFMQDEFAAGEDQSLAYLLFSVCMELVQLESILIHSAPSGGRMCLNHVVISQYFVSNAHYCCVITRIALMYKGGPE